MCETKEHIATDELLTEYLSGRTTDQVSEGLKHRIEMSEVDRELVREELEIWFSAGVIESEHSFDSDAAYQRFQNRMKLASVKSGSRVRHLVFRALIRAAAVLLILALPLVGYLRGKDAMEQMFSDIVVEAPLGSQTRLYLPDGTLVWLNAGSKMVYSQGFGVDNRNLRLEGEGYFEVAKDEKKPFHIHTKELDVRVLGTKFNFKNYAEDEEVVVNLMEGKVALTNGVRSMSELILNPEEKIILNKQTGCMVKMKTKAATANAWARNELFFDETLLEDIAKELSRAYNVKVIVADSLRAERFYGAFSITGNTVKEVLDVMAATQRVKYRYNGDEYIIY